MEDCINFANECFCKKVRVGEVCDESLRFEGGRADLWCSGVSFVEEGWCGKGDIEWDVQLQWSSD